MKSKELIKRIIRNEPTERIGYCFNNNNPNDFKTTTCAAFVHPEYSKYKAWGRYPKILQQVPSFRGEVCLSCEGNIIGRLDEKTKGECLKGVLQDGWELLDTYKFPVIDEATDLKIKAMDYANDDKYILAGLSFAVFSPLRDFRLMQNALTDVLLEKENVCVFLDRVTDISVEAIKRACVNGVDGVIIFDDLGMQDTMFFSPKVFREIFKTYYKKLADAIHNARMDFILHSCGKITEIIPDFIEAGVDVFQFDQPELHGLDYLAQNFAGKAAFFCPVDIQKIMPTGNKEIIEEGAKRMVDTFKANKCSLIVKDYPQWEDLNIQPQWQQWARDAVIKNGNF